MKKAIATINTENGIMTIYFNGENEEMTGEVGGTSEDIGYTPVSEYDAVEAVKSMYRSGVWGLEMITDTPKTYVVKEEYFDLFGADYTPYTLLTEDELKDLADGWEMTLESLLDQVEEAYARHIYIAREQGDTDGVDFPFFNKSEAVKKAEMLYAHLTESERETNTVSVCRYNIVVPVGMSAEKAYKEACYYDLVDIDPQEYEEVGD